MLARSCKMLRGVAQGFVANGNRHLTQKPSLVRACRRLQHAQASSRVGDVITSIERCDDKAWYEVRWADGHTARFPYVFLFDNCRCADCYHTGSYQRAVLMADVDPDVQPTGHSILGNGEAIQVSWPNGHSSPFPADWLKRHEFGKKPYDPLASLTKKSWGSEKAADIPVFKYDDVMEDDKALYDWLASLMTDGITLLKETRGEEGVVDKICKRIAWIRTTIYGNVFNVITMYDACSLAYTGNALGMHNDLPGFYYTPGVQMLHCIKQVESEGGDNQFVDGLRMAEVIQQEDPRMFEILKTMKIDFRTVGEEYIPYHVMTRRSLFEFDEEGNFKGINYNDGVRAPYWSLPVEQIQDGYRALKTFHRTMYSEDNFINYKLQKGEMVVFDNRRILHGRHGFRVEVQEGEESKMRHLEGAYLDWDEIKSKMRLIYEDVHGIPRF
ncbi:gamma-butyrobetaine dioxygenase-like [Diadema antillarum]|uniref:gamma-butyrobetaine dioxygenase-like n=1 Tax=Diadema antillarum TaxID=105358 RepID=UPI003A8B9E2C